MFRWLGLKSFPRLVGRASSTENLPGLGSATVEGSFAPLSTLAGAATPDAGVPPLVRAERPAAPVGDLPRDTSEATAPKDGDVDSSGVALGVSSTLIPAQIVMSHGAAPSTPPTTGRSARVPARLVVGGCIAVVGGCIAIGVLLFGGGDNDRGNANPVATTLSRRTDPTDAPDSGSATTGAQRIDTSTTVVSTPASSSAATTVTLAATLPPTVPQTKPPTTVVVVTTTIPPQPQLDPRFESCEQAMKEGFGPYVKGEDPEYDWYPDTDRDGVVCDA